MKTCLGFFVFVGSWLVMSISIFVLLSSLASFTTWDLRWFSIEQWSDEGRAILAVLSLGAAYPAFILSSFANCPYKAGGIVRDHHGR